MSLGSLFVNYHSIRHSKLTWLTRNTWLLPFSNLRSKLSPPLLVNMLCHPLSYWKPSQKHKCHSSFLSFSILSYLIQSKDALRWLFKQYLKLINFSLSAIAIPDQVIITSYLIYCSSSLIIFSYSTFTLITLLPYCIGKIYFEYKSYRSSLFWLKISNGFSLRIKSNLLQNKTKLGFWLPVILSHIILLLTQDVLAMLVLVCLLNMIPLMQT